MAGDTRAVRESEALDWVALTAYLREALPRQSACLETWAKDGRDAAALLAALTREPVVQQFGGGHSNLTYLLQFGDLGLVLRRPPLGPVPPRAHDMAREFRWLSALHPHFHLAPRPFLLCEDRAVVGSVFYVMERRQGLIVRDEEPEMVAGHPDRRDIISGLLVNTLAQLHRVDVTQPELAGLGKPAGFVARQVQGWSERWLAAQTEDLPEMTAVAAWLAAHLPPEPARASVVHGDFKLDNVMLDRSTARDVIAVLDWEMCALGDPLVDLGIFLGYWLPTPGGSPDDPHDALTTVTDRPGYWGRQAVLERYQAATGADLARIGFYETFAVFKLAVVLQQIFVRFVRGQTDDIRFATLGSRVMRLAHRAAALLERQS